jgi:hypothetical protein
VAQRPTPAWREYQAQAGGFFRSLGFETTVDAVVTGARATHYIDVLVEFETLGIRHLWVVECKLWRRRVPKERVLVLEGVVRDVGADRGFLLCEAGFQSGAITAARFANVTLTNLADLQANAQLDAQEVRLKSLAVAVGRLTARYGAAQAGDREAEPPPPEGGFWVPTDEFMKRLGELAILDMSVNQALNDDFPVVHGPDENNPARPGLAYDLETFVEKAEPAFARLDAWLEAHVAGGSTSA